MSRPWHVWLRRTVEEVYAYRTDKPHAVLALPFIGRHWAYGGRTCDPAARHLEHTTGRSHRAIHEPQPWSDLNPKRYVIFRRKARFELTTHLLECLVIKGLFCVYNWKDRNRLNPRVISPRKARVQRDTRDRTHGGSRYVRAMVRWVLYASVLAAVLSITIWKGGPL